jgi:putative transposase
MRGPKPEPIVLTDAVRVALEQLARRHTTPQQVALRARIVLAAAAGRNIAQTARDLGISLDMARLWRRRWLALVAASLDDLPVLDRLTDAPRSGKPVRITDAQVCQILELACEAPAHSGRPISHWSERELAAEVRARGIVEQISDRHAARLLKRGRSSRTAGGTG